MLDVTKLKIIKTRLIAIVHGLKNPCNKNGGPTEILVNPVEFDFSFSLSLNLFAYLEIKKKLIYGI